MGGESPHSSSSTSGSPEVSLAAGSTELMEFLFTTAALEYARVLFGSTRSISLGTDIDLGCVGGAPGAASVSPFRLRLLASFCCSSFIVKFYI